MKPANVGELSEYLSQNFESGEICELLDMRPEELVYYLKDPLEESFDRIVEELFDEQDEENQEAD